MTLKSSLALHSFRTERIIRAGLCIAALMLVGTLAFARPASAATQTAGNGIYNVHVDDTNGQYTATTAAGHPSGANLNVLFGNGSPGTSFNSLRSFTTSTNYTAGGGGVSLDPLSSTAPLGSTGFRTTYVLPGPATTPDALTIVQDVRVNGTTFDNSTIEVTWRVTNNGAQPVNIGIRYLWDYQIGSDDGPTFQQQNPNGAVLLNEASFAPPAFEYYRIEDNDVNPTVPTFNVLGTVNGPASVSPAPVPPTLVENASWPSSVGTPFDYTTSGQTVSTTGSGNDEDVLYYWGDNANNAKTIASGGTYTASESIVGVPPGATFPGSQVASATKTSGKCRGQEATIVGTPGPETIQGTNEDDVIQALAGNDVIKGLGGNDLVCGHRGRDRISGGPGNDTLIGGQGRDSIAGEQGNDRIFGGTPGAPPEDARDKCVGGGGVDHRKNCETGVS
jgi:Ca2+-binding RTX toxin-like protein